MCTEDVLVELQGIIGTLLTLADARQEDAHLHIRRILCERICHPTCRACIISELKIGTRKIPEALLGRISLREHIGKGIDDPCVLLLLHVLTNLLNRYNLLLCHCHRPFRMSFFFPPHALSARALGAAFLTLLH